MVWIVNLAILNQNTGPFLIADSGYINILATIASTKYEGAAVKDTNHGGIFNRQNKSSGRWEQHLGNGSLLHSYLIESGSPILIRDQINKLIMHHPGKTKK